MGGSTSQTSTTNSTTQTDPWQRTIPQLQGLLDNLGPQQKNVTPTANETNALAGLTANAQAGNPFAPKINSLATDLLNGGTDRSGMFTSNYADYKNALTPTATQSTNPYDNPAFANLITTLSNDTADRVKSAYAGSGYNPAATGDFSQQLGRGIAQGVAPTFLQAYNDLTSQKTGAINDIYAGGAQTAGLLTGLDQQALANRQAGVGASTAALQANDSPYDRMLQIEQQSRSLPLQNIGNVESLLLPMAQLGGTSNTNATTTSTRDVPLGQQIMGGALGGMGLLGGMGAFGPSGWLLSSGAGGAGLLGGAGGMSSMLPLLMMSDRRLKDDVEQVGALFDGTPVYRFRYKGEQRVQIGLMAQDVEQFAPQAVHEIGGFKAVDYRQATQRALGR